MFTEEFSYALSVSDSGEVRCGQRKTGVFARKLQSGIDLPTPGRVSSIFADAVSWNELAWIADG
jgi:hypothetical protein